MFSYDKIIIYLSCIEIHVLQQLVMKPQLESVDTTAQLRTEGRRI